MKRITRRRLLKSMAAGGLAASVAPLAMPAIAQNTPLRHRVI